MLDNVSEDAFEFNFNEDAYSKILFIQVHLKFLKNVSSLMLS